MTACSKTISPNDSLQATIEALPDGAVLCLQPGRYAFNGIVSRALTLRGIGAATEILLDGSGRTNVIKIDGDPNVTIENLTILHGESSGGGGAISAPGRAELTLRDLILRENGAGNFGGGALFVGGGHVTIDRCRFLHNRGDVGAAILIDLVAHATMTRSLVADNSGKAGAIVVRDGAALQLSRVTVAGNHVGAALELRGTKVRAPRVQVGESILVGGLQNGPQFAGELRVGHSVLSGREAGVTEAGENRRGDIAFSGDVDEPYRPKRGSLADGIAPVDQAKDLAGQPGSSSAGAFSPR